MYHTVTLKSHRRNWHFLSCCGRFGLDPIISDENFIFSTQEAQFGSAPNHRWLRNTKQLNAGNIAPAKPGVDWMDAD